MTTNKTIAALLLAYAAIPSLQAAESPEHAIVVTATRSPQTADESLASVTVLTRDDIAREQPQDLSELLRTQAGIDLTRAGGAGGNTSLFLRGTNSNHVLVLVDGVRAASATTGAFDWRSLPISQVERIEIVRGPRAVLYGSDAIGGVIQIFTRRPRGAEAAVGAGSYDTYQAEAGWGGGSTVQASVYASAANSNGFSAQNERGFSFDPDDDGYQHRSLSAAAATALSADTNLELRAWQNTGKVDFDQGTSDTLNRTVSARLRQRATNDWTHTLAAGYASDDLDTESDFPSRFKTDRYMADWQHDVALGAAGLLTAGLAYVQETAKNVDKSTDTSVYDRATHNAGLFALWQTRWRAIDVQAGLRGDDYSTFGTHGSGSLALGMDISATTRLWASYGSAFRAPNANELYSPGFGGLFAGNPDLGPERSRSAELGLMLKASATERVKINVFDTQIDDLIAFQGNNFQAINVDAASVSGVELEYEFLHGHWRHQANLTAQRARNDVDHSPLLYRPDQKATYRVHRLLGGGGTVGAELQLVSERTGLSERLPGYGLVALAAHWPVAADWFLEGRLENLFDKDYELIEGFNTPGRSLFVSVRYAPQPQTR
jgi:vitamin B12 transporter